MAKYAPPQGYVFDDKKGLYTKKTPVITPDGRNFIHIYYFNADTGEYTQEYEKDSKSVPPIAIPNTGNLGEDTSTQQTVEDKGDLPDMTHDKVNTQPQYNVSPEGQNNMPAGNSNVPENGINGDYSGKANTASTQSSVNQGTLGENVQPPNNVGVPPTPTMDKQPATEKPVEEKPNVETAPPEKPPIESTNTQEIPPKEEAPHVPEIKVINRRRVPPAPPRKKDYVGNVSANEPTPPEYTSSQPGFVPPPQMGYVPPVVAGYAPPQMGNPPPPPQMGNPPPQMGNPPPQMDNPPPKRPIIFFGLSIKIWIFISIICIVTITVIIVIFSGGGGNSKFKGETLVLTDDTVVGVDSDGKILITSDGSASIESLKQNTSSWEDIERITIGDGASLFGLKKDGTVVGAISNYGDVDTWEDIVQIDCYDEYIWGLKEDGTLMLGMHRSMNKEEYHEEALAWTDIVEISVGEDNIVGLKEDGTVVAATDYYYETIKGVETWSDIISINTDRGHTLGLKSDGTIVTSEPYSAAGEDNFDVSSFSDIEEIESCEYISIGRKKDGTVLFAGAKSSMTDPVKEINDFSSVVAKGNIFIGIRKDGSVILTSELDDEAEKFAEVNEWELKLP